MRRPAAVDGVRDDSQEQDDSQNSTKDYTGIKRVTFVLFTVALLAQAVPIARAMRIEPTVALRQD